MLPLKRQNAPPRSTVELWVKRLKANESVHVTILSPSLWGTWTHWNGSNTEPCYECKAKCPGHRKGLPTRWKGYLHVYDLLSKDCYFLELPPGAARQFLDLVGDDLALRGVRVEVKRQAGRKARLKFGAMGRHESYCKWELMPALDPYKSLCVMWGVNELDINAQGEPTIPLSGEAA